eukprot:scaffold21347_cov54-Attheya_sp.AAC.2
MRVGPVGTTCGLGRWVRRRTGSLVGTTLGGGTESSGSTIGTLGGLAWGGVVAVFCGAGVIRTGTLGGWAVGSGTGCAIGGSILGGRCLGVTCRKMSASCWIDLAWGRLSFTYGAAGAGLRRAWVRSCAARVATSADDIWGMQIVCGKKSTVSLTRAALVLVMYTWWHW